ncbi:hypothetical protein NE865_13558 [Phthorimaea operculella]|nr:hypothetical protein NE865_13558 [Phthorimaea operculella]
MWFAQFEAIVGPQNQSDKVKYELVIAKLGKEELGYVADLLDNPPQTDKYGTIKRRLMAVFEESAESQFNKLIREMDLGQQRPTQLLMKMRELAKSTGTGDDALKNLWISRMPAYVRAILAGSKDEPVDTGQVSSVGRQHRDEFEEWRSSCGTHGIDIFCVIARCQYGVSDANAKHGIGDQEPARRIERDPRAQSFSWP